MNLYKDLSCEKIAQVVLVNHFDRIFEVQIETRVYTEYDARQLDVIHTGQYDDWVILLARGIERAERGEFLIRMTLRHVLQALEDKKSFCVYYRVGADAEVQEYRLNISYFDAQKKRLLITRQMGDGNSLRNLARIEAQKHDSERFKFLISHICESFMEVNVRTGACKTIHSDSAVPEKATFKEQIEWWAEHVIVPEERERYLKEATLANLVQTLRAHHNFYETTYTATYGGSARCLLIVNALLKDPDNPEEEYIFSYAQDITSLKEQEKRNEQLVDISRQLLNLSQIEAMTRLLNRAAGEKIITDHLAKVGPGNPGTLLIIDIDHFKRFNDTYGHQVGDVVLKDLSCAMKRVFRSDDVLCRWGGDEFVIFMRNVSNIKSIEGRIERLRMKMRHCAPQSATLRVTISVGGIVAKQGDTLDTLFKEGDEALYQVKARGRDGFLILRRR